MPKSLPYNYFITYNIKYMCRIIQFSSVAQFFLHHMDCSVPGFPVHHKLLELAQTHIHQVSDAILAIEKNPLFSSIIIES